MPEYTLAEAMRLPAEILNMVPTAQLAVLLQEAVDMDNAAKAAKNVFNAVLTVRYEKEAARVRAADGKMTGAATFDDGGMTITETLPKVVVWDQDLLAAAVKKLEEWGEDRNHYVTTEMKVSETKFQAWPPAIQDLFTPARTVKPGNPTYKISPAKS